VIGIGMIDGTRNDIRRNHEQGNAGAIAKEIERLNVARVVVAAALVKGRRDGANSEQIGLGD
jgi:hypothetical protein